MSDLDLLRAAALGVALAAACGLRIFLPLLVVGCASLLGWVKLSGGLEWMGGAPALALFGVATLVEVAAYHVPWLDNVLDHLGAPVAIGAGVLLAAAMLPADDPLLRWTIAVIAGGGAAGAVHVSLALLRQASSLITGGLANPLLAFAEASGALLLTVAALALPALALVAAAAVVVAAVRLRRRRRMPAAAAP